MIKIVEIVGDSDLWPKTLPKRSRMRELSPETTKFVLKEFVVNGC